MAHSQSQPSTLLLLLLPLFLNLLLLLLTAPSAADEAFIGQQCAGSLHVDLCVATLKADPRSMACQDKPCLARTAVEHALMNASATATKASYLLKDIPPPPDFMRAPLQQCMEIYANVASYLNKALRQINYADYLSAEGTIDYANDVASNCEEAFPVHPTPMTHYNLVCEYMLDVAWDIVDTIVV